MVPRYANGSTPVHPPDQGVQQERREPRPIRGTLLHVLQLRSRASDPPRDTPAMEAGVSSHVWSIAEIVTLIDAVEKKTRVGTCLGDSSGGKDGNRDQLHRAISLDDPEAPELYRFDERVESRVWWEPSRPASTVGGETCRSCNVVCLLVRGYFFWTVRILTLTTTGCSMQLTKRRHE